MTINVAFCTDHAYVKHLSVALVSMLEHNKAHHVRVYVVSPAISERDLARLKDISSRYDSEIVSIEIDETQVSHLREHSHISRAMYYRIFLPTILDVEKVIYFDCDMAIEADIGELWSIDVSEVGCAGVQDENPEDHARLGLKDAYINSGSLIMNLAFWRQHQVSARCLEWLINNKEEAILPDQDAINVLLENYKIYLPRKWNLNPVPFNDLTVLDHYPSRVVHFGGPIKPWHLFYDFELQKIYRKYLAMTPWDAEFVMLEPVNCGQCLSVANQYFARGNLELAARYYSLAIRIRCASTRVESELLLEAIKCGLRLEASGNFSDSSALYRACFIEWELPVRHEVNIYRVPGLIESSGN